MQALKTGKLSVFQAGWPAPEAQWSQGLSEADAAQWSALLAVRAAANATMEKVRLSP